MGVTEIVVALGGIVTGGMATWLALGAVAAFGVTALSRFALR